MLICGLSSIHDPSMFPKGLQAKGATSISRLVDGGVETPIKTVDDMHKMLVSAKKTNPCLYSGVFITFHSSSPQNSPPEKIGETYSQETTNSMCLLGWDSEIIPPNVG